MLYTCISPRILFPLAVVHMPDHPQPSLLVVSGLDPSGGAGFIADVRVCEKFGIRAIGTVSAMTLQTTLGVTGVELTSPQILGDQLRAILSDIEVSAVKIGMIGNVDVACAVVDALALTAAPVVWDPVFCPTSGHVALFDGDFLQAAKVLLPAVSAITPNLLEAAVLVGISSSPETIEDMIGMGRALMDQGVDTVLVSGGHMSGETSDDVLVTRIPSGIRDTPGNVRRLSAYPEEEVWVFTGTRVDIPGAVHGTGCALSTALACGLAQGNPIGVAAYKAKQFIMQTLDNVQFPGRGSGAIV